MQNSTVAEISIDSTTPTVPTLDDGSINWRALVPKEFLYVNNKKVDAVEKKYGKPLAELQISEIDDSFLVIKLGGLKKVAQIRGFSSVDYEVVFATESSIVTKCTILWNPRPETNNTSISFSSLASVNTQNAQGMALQYYAETSENRAFCRAVRNFLRINVVSQEEIGSVNALPPQQDQIPSSNPTPHSLLETRMKEKGISLDKISDYLAGKGHEYKIEKIEDIKKPHCLDLLSWLKSV